MTSLLHRAWRPEWPCPAAVILRQQRHGPRDPSYAVTPDGAHWRSFMTPQGAGTLRVQPDPREGRIELHAFGPAAERLLDAGPALLGAADDVAGFTPHHRIVADLARRFAHVRFGRSGLVMDALVPAIIEQKVTGQEAFAGYAALLRRHGEVAPLPGGDFAAPRPEQLRTPPAARALRAIPSWEWLRLGVDPARSRAILAAARVAETLQRRVEETMADGSAGTRAGRVLQTVRGIGGWTSAETLRRVCGDADAVSFGDYHVAKDVGWALTGRRGDDEELAELLEPYRPHRARVPALLELAGVAAPRRGPRMAPRRHLPGR